MEKYRILNHSSFNMQIERLLAVIFLVPLLVCLASCSSDSNENDDLYGLIVNDKIPTQLVDKENLPGWLAELVEKAETFAAQESASKRPSRIYQLSWNGKKYYMHYDAFNSFIFYDVYTEDGRHVEWDAYDSSDFNTRSKDWLCIYIISN